MNQCGPFFDGGGSTTRMTVIGADGTNVYADEGLATNIVTFGADTVLARLFAMLKNFKRRRPELYGTVSAFTLARRGGVNPASLRGADFMKGYCDSV